MRVRAFVSGGRGSTRLAVVVLAGLVAIAGSLVIGLASRGSSAASGGPIAFCDRLNQHRIEASAGAHLFCARLSGGADAPISPAISGGGGGGALTALDPTVSANVDTATPTEDVAQSGLQAHGQSEVSVAAAGSDVVEAWNDATGFFTLCGATGHREELTGLGYSADGGATFTDLGGPPNANCRADVYFGDPSVEAWRPGGVSHFYISSLFDNPSFLGPSYLGLASCTAAAGTLSCQQPIKMAVSSECSTVNSARICSFLDKEFLAIDASRGRLYFSYTEFGVQPTDPLFQGQIDLGVCDIGGPTGTGGPAGGTATNPVCLPATTTSPYLVVAPGRTCEDEGAYPAVDSATGDVYVGYEFNWATSIFGPLACFTKPMQNVMTRIPQSCITLASTHSPCTGPAATNAVAVRSISGAFVPGYNRFPASDFPRAAVSDAHGTVSMVWNDSRSHPLADILLQSFQLGTLAKVQVSPVRLNANTGGWHFLPALRNVDGSGNLDVTWYETAGGNVASTVVMAATGVDPTTTTAPISSTLVTSQSSVWADTSSIIIPNFGDYTDNYFAGGTLYVAWSDGRIGIPQPYEAKIT